MVILVHEGQGLQKSEARPDRPAALLDSAQGKVIDRRPRVMLTGAKFIVSEAGRQRVLKEKRKNVHAFVIGELVDDDGAFGQDADGKDLPVRVTYNPYVAGTFMAEGLALNPTPVTGARGVLLNEHGMSACYLD